MKTLKDIEHKILFDELNEKLNSYQYFSDLKLDQTDSNIFSVWTHKFHVPDLLNTNTNFQSVHKYVYIGKKKQLNLYKNTDYYFISEFNSFGVSELKIFINIATLCLRLPYESINNEESIFSHFAIARSINVVNPITNIYEFKPCEIDLNYLCSYIEHERYYK